jgi:hypothetical protein
MKTYYAVIHLYDGEATLEREASTPEGLCAEVADIVRWFTGDKLKALGMADYNDEQIAKALWERKIPNMEWEGNDEFTWEEEWAD